MSSFSYETSSSRNTILSNTVSGSTYMVDIVEEQDETDDLIDMKGPYMSNQEYYKYNKNKYETLKNENRRLFDGNTETPDATTTITSNYENTKPDSLAKLPLRNFPSEDYEKKVEDIFKRSLSDSVDNEEVLSIEILDGKNEALNYQKMLNDNQMFLKDIKYKQNNFQHDKATILQHPQNNCDRVVCSNGSFNINKVTEHQMNATQDDNNTYQSSTDSCINTNVHIKNQFSVNSSPGIYDFACNCKVPHSSFDTSELGGAQPKSSTSERMSSQCILENYQNMYNDIRLGQVTTGFSQCDSFSENEYYIYGNQMEYGSPESGSRKSHTPQELIHLEQQKRLGNGLRAPPI